MIVWRLKGQNALTAEAHKIFSPLQASAQTNAAGCLKALDVVAGVHQG